MAETKTADAKTKTQQYEAMFLFGPTAANDLEGALNAVRGIIARHGGEVLVIKKWDERKLAYEIEGQKRGTYVICFFKGPGSAVTGIERDVNLSEEILRVMVLKADHLNADEMNAVEPQPIVPREERSYDRPWEDRGDRGPREGNREGGREGNREERPPRRVNRDEPLAETPPEKE